MRRGHHDEVSTVSEHLFSDICKPLNLMNTPQGIIDFLVYLAPSLLVFVTAWFLIKKFFDRETGLKIMDIRAGQAKDLLPLRLQAYERFALYLERISPNVMLLSLYESGLTVTEFKIRLQETIRGEFEHNFAQQIYITPALWTVIRNAKEEVIRVINTAASTLDPEAPAYLLSQKIFNAMLEKEEFPTQRALSILKAEVGQLF